MQEKLNIVLQVINIILRNSKIKIRRSWTDFLGDRLIQVSSENTLLGMIETLLKVMDAEIDVKEDIWRAFLKIQGNIESLSILTWIRKYPKTAAAIATLKREEIGEYCTQIIIENINTGGYVTRAENFDINLKITMLSPLIHGADTKMGNATLFRRMQAISNTNAILYLPFFSGNALRGKIRDLLADDFLRALDIIPSKTKINIALWFFYILYSGGMLEEESKASKALGKALGNNGAIKAEGVSEFRDFFPIVSLLGSALGNRIISGRIKVSDLTPMCKEWGNSNALFCSELFEWVFMTRREDYEGHEDNENKSMIVNTECLRTGTILTGGIDISNHTSEIEKSCLGRGLQLLKKDGYLGAEGRRGMGKMFVESDNMMDSELYDTWLRDNKEKILSKMQELEVI